MAKKQHNWPRIILQWGTLAALVFFLTGLASKLFGSDPADPEALCPMGGLQALATFFVKGSLPCSMSSAQILMGIALAAAVISHASAGRQSTFTVTASPPRWQAITSSYGESSKRS